MAQIEQRFIDAAINRINNQNIQSTGSMPQIERRFLDAALQMYTYNDPILVKQRQQKQMQAQAAADELQNYANQLKLVSDEATNAYKNYTEKRSAKEYQNQITDIKNRLTEILSGMADKQKQLEDLGYMSGETKQYAEQVQQYARELESVLNKNYSALQEEADFERKPVILQQLENASKNIQAALSSAGTGMWEAGMNLIKRAATGGAVGEMVRKEMERGKQQDIKQKYSDGPFRGTGASKSFDEFWTDKVLEQIHKNDEAFQAAAQQIMSFSDNPKLTQAVASLAYSLGYMIPSMVATTVSGGLAAPASPLSATMFPTDTLLSSLARSTVANPAYWTTAIPMYGNAYYEAKQAGASEDEAQIAGALIGFLGGAIETSGGNIGVLPTNKTSTLVNFIKEAIQEGGEEVAQGLLENAVASAIYRANTPVFSLEDAEAIINPVRALKEFAMGTFAGAVFGGVQAGIEAVGNKISSDANADGRIDTVEQSTSELSKQTNISQDIDITQTAQINPEVSQQFASEEALSRAADIAKKSGRNVVIVDTLNGKNGKYDPATNTIYLARDIPGDQAALFVLKHELTHSIQGTPEYQEFADYVLNSDTLFEIAATNNATVEDMINAVIAEAESDGQTLTREEAIAEIVADFVGSELFTNEQSIRQLAQQKPTIAQRILNFIRSLIAKVTGNEERTFLLNAERLYLKALRAPNTGTRYATLQELASRGAPDMQVKYAELLSKYGKHPRGEMPARNIDVPLMNEQGQPVPRGVRTALESQIVTDETVDIVKQRIIEGAISYQPISDAAANNYARSEIAQKGFEQCLNEWNGIIENGTLPNKNQIVTAEHLLRLAGQRGDTNTAARLIADLADVAARSGQVVQAMRMLKLLTPEGNLLLVQRAVKNLNNSKTFQKKVPKENRQKIAQLQEQITELQESSAAAERNFREAQDKLNALRKQRDAERQKLQSAALETETTETVTQEKLDSLKDDVAKAEILYSDAMANLETIRDTRDSLIRERDSLTGRTETAQKRTAEVESRIQELNKQIEEITPAYEQAVNELNEARETRDELKKILTSLENRTQTAISRTQKIWQKILEVNERIQQAQQELNEAVEAKENARSAQQTVDSLRRTIEKLEGKYFIPEENINDILSQTTPEGLEAARNRALKAVAKQVKASVWEKILAWRYMGMLGTVRMNEVNALANTAGYVAAVIKDVVGGVFEPVVQTVANKQGKEFERTKTLKAVLPFTAQKIRQFAAADYYAYEDVIAGGSKQNAFDIIRENRRIFKSKLLEGARNTVGFVPEKVDRTFLKANYVRALTQYLVANNINPDTATNEQLERARNYATKEAQRATFRLKSEAAIALNKLASSNKAAYILVEGTIPFKRTTINVLKSGLEYSPVGLLDGITRGTYQLAKGDITATEFIDKISTGLTGTGIMILGMILRSLGLLTGSVPDDDEGQFEDLQGIQRYSVKVGDKYYSIDWLSPTAMPLFVGVELYDVWKENENFTLARATEALALISEPVIEMSMLQGFRNMIEDTKYSDNEILTIGTSALGSYISQHIPTLFGQLARSLDDKQRRIYVESNGDIPVFLQKIYQTNLKKIPWANKALQPYIDEWGRIKESRSAVENFLIPGFVSEYQTSAMEQELQRLYKATNEGSVFPNVARKYITVDGKRIDLKANEYTQYAQAKGQKSYQLLTQLTSSSAYKALTDEQKVDAITKAYEYADALAKEKVSSYKLTDSEEKIREAEKAGISTAIYFAYRASVSGLKADKDEEGKPISGTKKAKVVEVINSLNLTPEQKDFLYLEDGYSEKEINQTPWHRQGSGSSTDWLYNFWGGVLGGN